MRVKLWLKVILFGLGSAVVFSMLSLLVDELVRPDREILLLNLKYLVYLIVCLVAAVSGIIVALVVLITRSRTISLIASAIVGFMISIGLIQGAVDLYTSTDFFDAPMFYADLVQIALNLMIYPIVCLLTWKLFRTDLTAAR